MLGQDLVAALRADGEDVRALARNDLDVTDASAVTTAVESFAADGPPLVVVNLAAWTAVDDAETNEHSAREINTRGASNVAHAVEKAGARMVQMSTDYVFDGSSAPPYAEDAPRSPVNAYGRTKAAAEETVLETLPDCGVVLRTAWLYGAHGPNFVRTILGLAADHETLDVVNDQVGQPTWTVDVAHRIVEVGRNPDARGVFHATNSGQATWFEFAQAVFTEKGLDPERIRPTTTDRFPRPAARPANSALGHERWAGLGLPAMRHWQEALAAFVTGHWAKSW